MELSSWSANQLSIELGIDNYSFLKRQGARPARRAEEVARWAVILGEILTQRHGPGVANTALISSGF